MQNKSKIKIGDIVKYIKVKGYYVAKVININNDGTCDLQLLGSKRKSRFNKRFNVREGNKLTCFITYEKNNK